MRLRFVCVGALAVTIAVVLLASVPLAGQAPAAATNGSSQFRTAWGHPDLQGVWASNSATPLERPKALAGKQYLTPAELAALEQAARELFDGDTDAAFGDSVFEAALTKATQFKSNDGGTGNYNHFWLVERNFDNRTSLIVDPPDGRLPPMTEEARKRQVEAAAYRKLHPADGPEDRGLGERCIGAGVPMTGRGYNSNYQILQTPTHVAIYMEMMHDTRIIPLDARPHVSKDILGYLGDSRGRWEGNTLVVETTNFTPKRGQGFRGTSATMHLTEKFRRIDGGTLEYEYTVNDPSTYTRPYTAMIRMSPAPGSGKIYEFACHEGNHGMEGILAGHRAQEKAAQASRTGSR
jgi:hypothetical protein